MTPRLLSACALALLAAPLAAQSPALGGFRTAVRSGVVYEGYGFGAGLAFDRVTELTVPLVLSQRLGSRIAVDLSTAYASASVRTSTGSQLDLSGIIDTDIRGTFTIVPSRLIVTLVGTLPTGKATVPDSVIPLFGVLATDLLDFMTPSFGQGGALTGGLATALKLSDNWALGAAASYRYTATYVPVDTGSGGGDQLSPGDEGRVRVGLEGPLGGGKYFRGALIYSLSEHDQLGGGDASIIGDRLLAYMSLSMPLGRSNLALYVFNMNRFRARAFSTTYQGAVRVPKGDVFAFGGRLERPLSPNLTLVPLLEGRVEWAATDSANFKTELLGALVRAGADLRYRLSGAATVVVQAQGAFGGVRDQGAGISLVGPRLGVLVEWTR